VTLPVSPKRLPWSLCRPRSLAPTPVVRQSCFSLRTLLFFSNADPISALPGGDWDHTWRAALTSALVPGFAPGIFTSTHLQIRAMATVQGLGVAGMLC
jgi:hypothetical protein